MNNMKKTLKITTLIALIGILFLALSVAPIPKSEALAALGIPFGGPIITIIPCNTGALITLGGPRPGQYMYMPGTRSFLFGPPIHPGQWLLGLFGPPVPCVVGLFVVGGGAIITMHGSSR